MSLLDDVSIVITPNAYNVGTLYAVIPVPTEGADVIVDGNFPDGSTAWALNGWTISGNAANCSGISANMIQNISGSTNKQFLITFTLSNYISGSVRPAFVGGYDYSPAYNANGVYTTVISSYSDIRFVFYSNSFDGSVSNVSVKEYTSADMDVTRETAATRVDENGLVNYAEVLGSELVSCGDFDCADPDAVWSAFVGWDINGGKAEALNVNGSNLVQDNITFTNTKTYKIQFSISDYVSGEVRVRFSGGAGFISTDYVSGNNTHTLYLQSIGNTVFRFQGQNNFTASIDNVSVKEVTRDNVPRIDYTGGGCPHILAEPQRTNLVTNSEDFNAYRIAGSTVTPNSTTSPDGTNSGILVTQGTSTLILRVSGVVEPSTTYTFSGYFKSSSSITQVILDITDNGNTTFDLTNEWQRFSVTAESRAGGSPYHFVDVATNGSQGDTFYAWGLQVEEGSYATSYIPTSGSTVTRNQDQFTRDGIGSLINSTEGVLFAEIAALSNDLSYRRISVNDASTNNRIGISYDDVSNRIRGQIVIGGVSIFLVFTSTDITEYSKIALKYKTNDFALWVDGIERDTDISAGVLPSNTLNNLSFDNGGGGNVFNGKVKQLQVYDTALTDTQLAALTS